MHSIGFAAGYMSSQDKVLHCAEKISSTAIVAAAALIWTQLQC